MQLREIAHVRSGDKGDISQISVIAYRSEDFPWIVEWVTSERVALHFPRLSCSAIDRYELPSIGALNLVLKGALPGGVTRSPAVDVHGTTLAMQLLTLEISDV